MIDPRIRQLHDEAPLVDLHCHPPLKLFLLEDKQFHQAHEVTDVDDPFSFRVDLPSLLEGRVRVAFATTHVPERFLLQDCVLIRGITAMNARAREALTGPPDEITRRMLQQFEAAVETAHNGGFAAKICKSFAELKAALKTDDIALLHAIEGGHSLRGSRSVLENLEAYYNSGVCLLTLAHFYDHQLSPPVPGIPHDHCLVKVGCFQRALRTDPELGLHPDGRDAVRFMLERGMLVDLTHSTRKARYDIYKIWQDTPPQYRRPLVISHAGLYELAPFEMNPTLSELNLLRETGGVMGIIFTNYWLMGKTLKGAGDTMEYVLKTIDFLFEHGFEDQIALGSDFDGFTNPPRGLQEPSEFPDLTDELLTRRRFPGPRYTANQVRKFLGGNVLRTLEAGWGRTSEPQALAATPALELFSAPPSERIEYLRALGCWVPETPVAALGLSASVPVGPQPLDAAALAEIRVQLRDNPKLGLDRPPHILGASATTLQIDRLIDRVEERLAQPRAAFNELAALRAVDEADYELPEECRFPGYDNTYPRIKMSRSDMQDDDWGGWAVSWVNALWYRINHTKPALPLHDSQATNFCYPLRSNGGSPTIALFSDWGSGYYHSQYIARHLATLQPGQAVHLGDIYYAGSPKEMAAHATEMLRPLLGSFPVYMMNGNHEMMHHGRPLLELIEQKRNNYPEQQPQESTYFCLHNEHYQVIAIDTDFHRAGRYPENALLGWLEQRLRAGRSGGKVNILLSQHEPFNGTSVKALLLKDLNELVLEQQLVDLWFWGDEHGAALYHPGPTAPFIGALIGHGGYPFRRWIEADARPNPDVARLAWVETAARFPTHPGSSARQDIGNNGFVWLKLEPAGIELKFVDWRRQLRYHTRILRDPTRQGRLWLPENPIDKGEPQGTCGNPV